MLDYIEKLVLANPVGFEDKFIVVYSHNLVKGNIQYIGMSFAVSTIYRLFSSDLY